MTADLSAALARIEARLPHEIPRHGLWQRERDALDMLAVLRAVLAVHRPTVIDVIDDPACCAEECDHEGECPATGTLTVCAGCDAMCEEAYAYYAESNIRAAEYPCATVRAMTTAWEEQR